MGGGGGCGGIGGMAQNHFSVLILFLKIFSPSLFYNFKTIMLVTSQSKSVYVYGSNFLMVLLHIATVNIYLLPCAPN